MKELEKELREMQDAFLKDKGFNDLDDASWDDVFEWFLIKLKGTKINLLKDLFKKATNIDYNIVVGSCLQRNPTLQAVVDLIRKLE